VIRISKKEELLKVALEDPIRKKYGFNILFADKNKKPLVKNWNQWIKKKQTDKDLKKMIKPSHTNYGYVSGFNGLLVIDFDAHWIYQEALNYFGERLNTFTVETPNGGFHAFFIVKNPSTDNTYKNSLKVEILGGMNAIVYGYAQKIGGGLGEYKVYNKDEIRRDNDIVKDMKKFLRETLTTYDFLNYRCISEKLGKKINHLTHEQRLHISNLFLQKNAPVTLVINFFRMCSDFDPKITKYQIETTKEKVVNGKIKYPTCKSLAKDFDFDRKNCDGCIRTIKKDRVEKKRKVAVKMSPEGEIEIMTPERLFEEVMNLNKRINHGMHLDPDLGILYTSKIEGKKGIYGVGRDIFVKAIHESEIEEDSDNKKYFVVKGYTTPLSEATQTAIVEMSRDMKKHKKKDIMRLSDLFTEILDNAIFKYIEFRDPVDYLVVGLWAIGTYYRVLWTWYPYLTFVGLRDVGKSTALGVLSYICFNGEGFISGSSSEASIFRKASSSKGIILVDHYESIRKNKEKKQTYEQLMENAWYLKAVVDRTNMNTYEVEMYNIACSIAVGTRYSDEVLDEKGIKINMFGSSNKEIQRRSSVLSEDIFWLDIQKKCMMTALYYQQKVMKAYRSIPLFEGLTGRDWNKFKPLLALAKVIDDETNKKYDLFNKVVEYGINYRKTRKEEVSDLEEVLLKVILERNIRSCKYSYLANKMHDEGYKYYKWQTAQTDLGKLGIVKWVDRRKSPNIVYIDIERAKEVAKHRAVDWTLIEEQDELTDSYSEFEELELDELESRGAEILSKEVNTEFKKIDREEFLMEELSEMEQEILKIVANPSHQNKDGAVMRSKVVEIVEALYEKDRDDVENLVNDMVERKVIFEPRYGFLGVRKKNI